ncbi:MAG: hypothetical protein LQ349_007031 [Xanthoria aureola]|nr:MAG: hypothetical protein LQ349_007031 [Xanthoria aureola]
MEQLEIHSKSYLVRWADVKADCTISWSIQPHKKSIRFGIFKHPGAGIAPAPKLPSSTFEAPPTPGLHPTDSASDPLQQPEAASAAVGKLKSIGLKPIVWHGTCEANRVTTGRWDVPRDEGGMYALVFDNTFAKQLSKTVTFVLLIYPTDSFPPNNRLIQGRAANNGGSVQEIARSRLKLGPRDSSDSVSQIETPLSEAASTETQRQNQGQPGDRGSNQFSGTLRKRRRKRHQGFARRFFSLDFSTATLSYYHDRHNATIRGAIPLSLAAIGANGKTRDISIDSGAEIWHLRASNAREFEAWKGALEFARTSRSPASPATNLAVDTNATNQAATQVNPDQERIWAKVESLVNRIQQSRETARRLAKETDPRYLPLSVPKPPFERKSTASSASESPSEQSPGPSFASEGERRPFWKRKPSNEKASSAMLKRSVSAQPITTPFRGMPSTPNESSIPLDTNKSLASHTEEGLHDHCVSLLQELDSVAAEFTILLAESKQRRTLSRPTPVSMTSRHSLDTLGESQEFYDAECGDTSQLLAIQHESDDDEEDDRSDHEHANDDDSASDVEASGSDGSDHAPPNSTNSAYPPKAQSLSPLPSKWVKRRDAVQPPTVAAPSLIGFFRKNVGKDLSTVSMPVSANEPLSLLQRASEQLEYSHLLDTAATSTSQSSTHRLLYITAFAISTLSYSRVKERAIRKPFNPILGETYELVREDRGFRFVAEKISHRPVRMACQAESEHWSFVQAPMPTQKFWGKSVELMTDGKVRIVLHELNERFSWTPTASFLRNIIAGEKYVEPVGTITVTNESTGEYAKCTFKTKGMFSGRSEDVAVQTFDHYGDELPSGLTGKWTTSLTITENGHAKDGEIWKVDDLPSDASKRYGYTTFATQLNEITSMESNKIPPTDSRLRPDQRKLEEGDVDAAEATKARLEEAQRKRRKDQEEGWEPRWFRKVEGGGEGSGEECWRLKEGAENYWEKRARGAWAGLERVFDDS